MESHNTQHKPRRFCSGLRGRTLLFMAAAYGVVACIALGALWAVGGGIARDLGSSFAERLVLWHKERASSQVGRNLALARQLAANPSLIEWARDEADPDKRQRALGILESYRERFDSPTYFVALAESGHYYFSKQGEEPSDGRPEHSLHKDNPNDAWFYELLDRAPPFNINVDDNEKLGVTKVWLNIPIQDRGEVLGVTGTGVDLTRFVQDFTSPDRSGVTTMLLDRAGAIQIHPETSRIAFDTASGQEVAHTFASYVDGRAGRERLGAALDRLARGEEEAAILNLRVEGHERLVAAAWMERLDWYAVAVLDLSSVLGWPELLALGAVLAAALTALLVLLAFLLDPLILRPVRRLSTAAAQVAGGDYSVRVPDERGDELGVLSRGFNNMTEKLSSYTRDLEARVAERTREAEAARQYFESILENTPVGIAFLDGERRIRQVNQELLRLLGFEEGKLVNRTSRVLHPDEATFERLGREAYPEIARGATYREVVELQRADGGTFHCAMAGRAVNPEDLQEGYIWSFRDMSEHIRLQEDLRAAKEEAEAATEAKSAFLANMSHEIRTPLNAVLGLTHLLLRTELSTKQSDYARKIRNSSQALLGLINDILDFSKIEAGKLSLEHKAFDLHDVMDTLSNVVTLKAEEKSLELLFAVEPEVPGRLVGDALRLGQVLTNLATNAVKFTEEGEVVVAVSVASRQEDRAVLRFAVRDTGIGLTAEQQEGLFEAFEQADTSSTRKYEGTGLGLAISQQLVQLMGGELQVESELGAGSTFWFEVPFGIAEGDAERAAPACLKARRVLVVDDNDTARQILTSIITGFGFEVTTASDGETALETLKAAEAPFDLVLMDWHMPGMDGIEATRRIKADPSLHAPPAVLMVTAYGHDELMDAAEEAGLDAFLMKPIGQSLLFDTLLEVLEGVPGRSSGKGVEPPEAASDLAAVRGARVLLVEDNEINQEVARELLEQAGVTVSLAEDGKQGVTRVRSEPFDLVLMDVQMPEMDGLEATRRIRSAGYSSLPIVAMTAHAMEGDKEQSFEAGMDGHLTKPIDPQELTKTLLAWIAAGDQQAAASSKPVQDSPAAAGQTFPDLEGLDTAQGLRSMNGSQALYHKLLAAFPEKNADAAERIRLAGEEGRQEEATRLAHSIKGAAGSLGALEVQEAAHCLEDALRGGKRVDEAEDLLLRLEAALRPLCDGLRSFYAAAEPRVSSAGPDVDRAAELVHRLRDLVLEGDIEAEDVADELREALAGSELESTLEALAERLADVEFDEAASLVEDLAQGIEKECSNG